MSDRKLIADHERFSPSRPIVCLANFQPVRGAPSLAGAPELAARMMINDSDNKCID